MKKLWIGVLIGFALAIPVGAHAEEIVSMIGKKVDGMATILVDGTQLSTQAVIIEGTSYAPIRAIGEAVGKEVDWKDGVVTLVNVDENELNPQYLSKVINRLDKVTMKESGPNDFQYLEIDGNKYVNAGSIGYTATWKKPIIEYKISDDKTVEITVSDNYYAGADGFVMSGHIMIKLSALGLKATIDGETLIIEKQ